MEKSKSEILREWIKNKLDNNYNYSTKENRTLDFEEFVKSHNEFDVKADKPLYHAILKKEIIRKGLDPRTFGLVSPKPNFPESDMIGTINPQPVPWPKPQPKEPTEGENEAKTEDETVNPKVKQETTFTVPSVGMTMKMMFNFLKLRYPFMDALTQEEQEVLGQVWLPVFRRYLEKNWAVVGVAMFSTTSIMTTKIKQAKEKAKEKQDKDKSSDVITN